MSISRPKSVEGRSTLSQDKLNLYLKYDSKSTSEEVLKDFPLKLTAHCENLQSEYRHLEVNMEPMEDGDGKKKKKKKGKMFVCGSNCDTDSIASEEDQIILSVGFDIRESFDEKTEKIICEIEPTVTSEGVQNDDEWNKAIEEKDPELIVEVFENESIEGSTKIELKDFDEEVLKKDLIGDEIRVSLLSSKSLSEMVEKIENRDSADGINSPPLILSFSESDELNSTLQDEELKSGRESDGASKKSEKSMSQEKQITPEKDEDRDDEMKDTLSHIDLLMLESGKDMICIDENDKTIEGLKFEENVWIRSFYDEEMEKLRLRLEEVEEELKYHSSTFKDPKSSYYIFDENFENTNIKWDIMEQTEIILVGFADNK